MEAVKYGEQDVLASIAARGRAWRSKLANANNVRSIGPSALDVVQRELEAVIGHIDYGVYVMGPDYRSRIINSTFQDMWSLPDQFVEEGTDFFETIEYLRHVGMYDVAAEDWPAYVQARFDDVRAADGTPRESVRQDGRVLLYKTLPLPDGGRMLTYFDITEQKSVSAQLEQLTESLQHRVQELEQLRGELRSERDAAIRNAQAMRESQELLAEAIESIDEAILVWNHDRRLIACNQRIRSILPRWADHFQVGNSYQTIMRAGVDLGIFSLDEGASFDEFVEHRWHLESAGATDEHTQLADGRWLRINRRKTSHGKRVVTISDITVDKKNEADLRALAENDALTGLANRRTFDNEIEAMTVQFASEDLAPPVGLLLIDLDKFKEINDTHGHLVGDEVLKIAARRITHSIRRFDVAARIGGDEFAVIQRDVPDQKSLRKTANRLLRAMARPMHIAGQTIVCSFSIGGAHCMADTCPVGELMDLADRALYTAKDNGRNGVRIFSDLQNQDETSTRH
ncbi:MAG: diguanylate cyclase [Pseudomonadota bacterium]